VQDSAHPYHDWNERVTAEAYAPNSASRILDGDGRIAQIVNNYARISFNMGPTLLSWMQEEQPELHDAIVQADRDSVARFGRGSALAQAYHHLILPLANERDRRTQVRWGVADFRHRFGRMPDGMWLAETAVDIPTLEALAAEGIRFTILSPYQAKRVRDGPDDAWRDATGARIDPSRPYLQRLPSGRSITLFFYDAPVSQAVAFERLLADGNRFAARLLGGLRDDRAWPQLMHIATDGESYGHHHPHGDMALAVALRRLEAEPGVRLTNYASFLADHPATAEVEVAERTAWSCAHGVGRWSEDCGCNSGRAGWNQKWRGPLRAALDRLRDTLGPLTDERGRALLEDPWAARDAYVEALLDRSRLDGFLARHLRRGADATQALKLLEMQRHLMMMYTSCGWFFDEVSGVETTQVLTYAARAVQLGEGLFGVPLQERFLQDLERAPSNLPEHGNARRIVERLVLPARVDLAKVAAHDAIGSLFGLPPGDRLGAYAVERTPSAARRNGRSQLAAGRIRVASRATREGGTFDYAAVHFGDHNVLVGVHAARPSAPPPPLPEGLESAFDRGDLAETVRLVDAAFGGQTFSLASMFQDKQRQVVRTLLAETLRDARAAYGAVYDRNAHLIRYLTAARTRVPRPLRIAAAFVLGQRLMDALRQEPPDEERVRSLVQEARQAGAQLDSATLGFALRDALDRTQRAWLESPRDLPRLQAFARLAALRSELPFQADVWRVQNRLYAARPLVQDVDDPAWRKAFADAAAAMSVRV